MWKERSYHLRIHKVISDDQKKIQNECIHYIAPHQLRQACFILSGTNNLYIYSLKQDLIEERIVLYENHMDRLSVNWSGDEITFGEAMFHLKLNTKDISLKNQARLCALKCLHTDVINQLKIMPQQLKSYLKY